MMEDYIIRIYRRDPENPDCLVGVVEEVGKTKHQAFHSCKGLGLYQCP